MLLNALIFPFCKQRKVSLDLLFYTVVPCHGMGAFMIASMCAYMAFVSGCLPPGVYLGAPQSTIHSNTSTT
jgi:hypothetical protein